MRGAKFCVKNEDIHQLLSNGVQFPKAMADDILAKNNISRAEAKSNADIDISPHNAGGNVIKIDAGDRANPTSLAANGDAGTQFQASIGAPVDGESRDPKAASLDVSLDASSGGNVSPHNAGVQHGGHLPATYGQTGSRVGEGPITSGASLVGP